MELVGKTLISVIIPVYNVEKYLRSCLDSIIHQHFTNFEVILVDDGSTDKSNEICSEYASKDSRFVVYHKENEGVSVARNYGMEKAKGEWVYFVDADDELFPDCLEHLYSLTDENTDLVMAGYVTVCQDGSTEVITEEKVKRITKDDSIMLMYEPQYFDYLGYIWIKLFRLSLIHRYQIHMNTQIFFNEDRLFTIEYLCKMAKGTVFSTKQVYKYYIRPNSAMASLNRSFNPKFITDFKAYILMKDAIKESGATQAIKKLAEDGILISWHRIRHMMRKFGVKDKSIKWYMLKEILKNVNFITFLKDRLNSIKMRLIKK